MFFKTQYFGYDKMAYLILRTRQTQYDVNITSRRYRLSWSETWRQTDLRLVLVTQLPNRNTENSWDMRYIHSQGTRPGYTQAINVNDSRLWLTAFENIFWLIFWGVRIRPSPAISYNDRYASPAWDETCSWRIRWLVESLNERNKRMGTGCSTRPLLEK